MRVVFHNDKIYQYYYLNISKNYLTTKNIMLNSLQPVEMVSQGFSFFLEVSGESNF